MKKALITGVTGERIALYDINQKAIETVGSGKMPFLEQSSEEMPWLQNT